MQAQIDTASTVRRREGEIHAEIAWSLIGPATDNSPGLLDNVARLRTQQGITWGRCLQIIQNMVSGEKYCERNNEAMPRGARLDSPGTLHHVIVRGIERKEIVNDHKDRKNFLTRMGDIALETGTAIL